jgi:single-strand DNA-binding protein
MSLGHNSFTFIGNVTDTPVRRAIAGDRSLAEFSIAVNNRRSRTDEKLFLKSTAWNRLGDVCTQYLKKGSSVLVSGSLRINTYEDKDGNKREKPEFTVNKMTMLGEHSGAGVNRGLIVGTLTRDPELAMLPNGSAKARMRLAINDPMKKDAPALFLTVEVFGKTAEIAAKILKAGTSASFDGRLSARTYERKAGGKGDAVAFIADNFEVLKQKRALRPAASDMPETASAEQARPPLEIPF